MSSKPKTTKPAPKSEALISYKTKKPWKDGGIREVATAACKSGASVQTVAKALSKARGKTYSAKTTMGVLGWLAAKGFLERVEA